MPRWEIDWILRWRRERVCFPDIFTKPSIRDLLGELLIQEPIPRFPKPEPDPAPFLLKDGGLTLRRVEQLVGQDVAGKLAAIETVSKFGANIVAQQEQVLDAQAFSRALPPPLSTRFRQRAAVSDSKPPQISQATAKLDVSSDYFARIDPNRYIGPFIRCRDTYVPEWVPILDVPDITFRVTQDVNGDGTEETIYSEGYFDVRWNAGSIPNVTLEASAIAIASVSCNVPDVTSAEPAIEFAGLMPLAEPYHNVTTGYALRPNQPRPSGNPFDPGSAPATTPYTGTLQLYGCNRYPGAAYYRILYSFNGSAMVPFTDQTWPVYRFVGGLQKLNVTPDSNGWYPILNPDDGWSPPNLLLNWSTAANGLYRIQMELADAGKSVIPAATTGAIAIQVDNNTPTAQFTGLAWRVVGTTSWTELELICPVVTRPRDSVGNPVTIEFQVRYLASATHLRSVFVSGGGCGSSNPVLISTPDTLVPPLPTDAAGYWHKDALDNSISRTVEFSLSGGALQGAYSFGLNVSSRAFNPAGGDSGFASDWLYDPVVRHISPSLSLVVVNA